MNWKKWFQDSNNKPPLVVLTFSKMRFNMIYKHSIHKKYHMRMLKQEDLNLDTHPLYYSESCHDTINMIDDYGRDHYAYNDILNLYHDRKELNDLNDIFPLNKTWKHIEQKIHYVY